jgi:hypothetical protein
MAKVKMKNKKIDQREVLVETGNEIGRGVEVETGNKGTLIGGVEAGAEAKRKGEEVDQEIKGPGQERGNTKREIEGKEEAGQGKEVDHGQEIGAGRGEAGRGADETEGEIGVETGEEIEVERKGEIGDHEGTGLSTFYYGLIFVSII